MNHKSCFLSPIAILTILALLSSCGTEEKDIKTINNAGLESMPVDLGNITVGEKSSKEITLKNSHPEQDITKIEIILNKDSQLKIKNKTSCNIIKANSDCKFLAVFHPKTASSISEIIKIVYEINGKSKTEKISVSWHGVDKDNIIVKGNNFGDKPVLSNTPGRINLLIEKQSGGVSAKQFNLTGLPTELKINTGLSSCLLANSELKLGGICSLVLDTIHPITTPKAILSHANLNYILGKNVTKKISLQLRGQFLPEQLEIDGQNFGVKNIISGDSTLITILIKNPNTSSITAKNFSLTGLQNPLITLDADPLKSTCLLKTLSLTAGNSCSFELTIKPSASQNFSKDLKISFTSLSINHDVPFTVSGQFHLTAKPVLPPTPKGFSLWDLFGGIFFGPPSTLKARPSHLLNDDQVQVANNYYREPYPDNPNDYILRAINGSFYKVNRPNHGLAHSIRKAALGLDTLNILRDSKSRLSKWVYQFIDTKSADYNPNFEQQLAFALLMFRSGRFLEGNTKYKEGCYKSAENFVREAKGTGLFPNQKDIDDIEFAFQAVGDLNKCFDTQNNKNVYTMARGCTKNRLYLYNFLYGIHHLDLRRMTLFKKADILDSAANFLGFSGPNAPEIQKLWDRSGQYLLLTGDRDMGPPHRFDYADPFFILSHDPKTLREKVETMQKTPF